MEKYLNPLIKITISLIVILSFVFIPQNISADGVPFSKPNKFISEEYQRAIIIREGNQEILILSTTFNGDPDNFAWVIPIPSEPKIDKVRDEVFVKLEELTTQKSETKIFPQKFYQNFGRKENKGIVNIVKTEEIGVYDISILASTDSEELLKWLKTNGYNFPSNAQSALEYYINNNWYFIAAKVDPTKINITPEKKFFTGHTNPLKISFNTTKLIYPLKLTSLVTENKKLSENITSESSANTILESEETSSQVLGENNTTNLEDLIRIDLYVFSDKKVKINNFTPEFANWIKKEDIENLTYTLSGESFYQPKSDRLFLTKLVASIHPSEIKEDIEISEAGNFDLIGIPEKPNNLNSILMIFIYASIGFIIFCLSPFGMLFIFFTYLQFSTKSQSIKIISWIFQIFLFILLLVISFFWSTFILRSKILTTIAYLWEEKIWVYSISAALFIIIILKIIVFIFQITKHISDNRKKEKIADEIFSSKGK